MSATLIKFMKCLLTDSQPASIIELTTHSTPQLAIQ